MQELKYSIDTEWTGGYSRISIREDFNENIILNQRYEW